MRRRKPRAYAQGDLDYLCGVYAVVNAVRYAVSPLRPFRSKDCRGLFRELVTELNRRRALRYSLVEGNSSRDISRLLRASAEVIAAKYEISLTYRRPFHTRVKVPRGTLITSISSHCRQPGTAVLVGFSWHWTVVLGVTPNSFRLLDSAYIKRIRFDDFTIGTRVGADRNKYRLLPSWVFFVRAAEITLNSEFH